VETSPWRKETRNPKSETRNKFEFSKWKIQNKKPHLVLDICLWIIRNCFGFRVSDFGLFGFGVSVIPFLRRILPRRYNETGTSCHASVVTAFRIVPFSSMSDSGRHYLDAVVEEFRRALEDCEHLYVTSAQECLRLHPEMVEDSRRDFLHRMVDLHRGLILKIFLAVAFVDRHWSHEDIVLAGTMFEHLWGRRLNDSQIRQSLDHFLEQSGLTWDVLLGPFDRLESFRQRIDQIQTVVLRIANLVAKADGRLSPEEARQLEWIQAELKRVLVRLPLADDETKEIVKPAGAQQLKEKPFDLGGPSLPNNLKPRKTVQLESATPQQVLDETLAELDGLIGLESIKQEVRGLINFLKMEKARQQFGLPPDPDHAAFRLHRQSGHRQDHGGPAAGPALRRHGHSSSRPSH
jgi:hypothetical protein